MIIIESLDINIFRQLMRKL